MTADWHRHLLVLEDRSARGAVSGPEPGEAEFSLDKVAQRYLFSTGAAGNELNF